MTQVKAADIAKAYNITEFNVLKIIPLLVHGGFVKTMRGRRGGLRLARPASEIRIGDVVRLTEETHIQADCFGQLHEECLIQHAAPINRILDSALDAFIEVLDQHTLQDLVAARPPAHDPRPGRAAHSTSRALVAAERAALEPSAARTAARPARRSSSRRAASRRISRRAP